MFKKNKVTDIERKLYEKEITSLKKELAHATSKLELAEKYKMEYMELAEEYKIKIKEVDKLKHDAGLVNDEVAQIVEIYKNNV